MQVVLYLAKAIRVFSIVEITDLTSIKLYIIHIQNCNNKSIFSIVTSLYSDV